jgi:hypothetical protein
MAAAKNKTARRGSARRGSTAKKQEVRQQNKRKFDSKTQAISYPKMWKRKGWYKRVVYFADHDQKGRIFIKTSGGLFKCDLMQSKCGKIVSKGNHQKGQARFQCIRPFAEVIKSGVKELGASGFIVPRQDGTQAERALYKAVMEAKKEFHKSAMECVQKSLEDLSRHEDHEHADKQGKPTVSASSYQATPTVSGLEQDNQTSEKSFAKSEVNRPGKPGFTKSEIALFNAMSEGKKKEKGPKQKQSSKKTFTKSEDAKQKDKRPITDVEREKLQSFAVTKAKQSSQGSKKSRTQSEPLVYYKRPAEKEPQPVKEQQNTVVDAGNGRAVQITRFKIGDKIVVHSLSSALGRQINGNKGTLIGFCDEGQRCKITLDSEFCTDQCFRFLPKNLSLLF